MMSSFPRRLVVALALCFTLTLTACNNLTVPRPEGTPTTTPAVVEDAVTDVRHFNFMMDSVKLKADATHSTYNIANSDQAMAMWFDSDRNEDGSYTRRGSGEFTNGKWAQGAYRLDDISGAAVAAIKHWQLFRNDDSRNRAYELLRTAAFMQNVAGPQVGLSVRWMQQDGSLNNDNAGQKATDLINSATINPSDSATSDWFASYVWALGEGYSAFKDQDPTFAKFLNDRIKISETAINAALTKNQEQPQETLDGIKVSQAILNNNVQVNANIALGLSAYLKAVGSDSDTEKLLKTLTDAIGTTAIGDQYTWPFGAIMSSSHSQSYWSAANSGANSALTAAAPALKRSDVMNPALFDTALWSVYLLTGQGVSNTLSPMVSDDNQSATGVDLRLRGMIDVGKQSEADGITGMAAMVAGWYFGANKASKPMFDKDSGAFYKELKADKTIDTDSSAEANIHGILSMVALDANPNIKKEARSFTSAPSVEGAKFYDVASGAIKFEGSHTVDTPSSAWTGDSNIAGGKVAQLNDGSSLTLDVGDNSLARKIYPVLEKNGTTTGTTEWFAQDNSLGKIDNNLKDDKASPWSLGTVTIENFGNLAPKGPLTLKAKVSGVARLNGILVQPQVTKADFGSNEQRRMLYFNNGPEVIRYPVQLPSSGKWITKIYDSKGRYVSQEEIDSSNKPEITVAPSGFSIVEPLNPSDIAVNSN